MKKAEEYFKSTTFGKLFSINKRKGLDPKFEVKEVIRFAEAYHQSRVNVISDDEIDKIVEKWTEDAMNSGKRSDTAYAIEQAIKDFKNY